MTLKAWDGPPAGVGVLTVLSFSELLLHIDGGVASG